MVQACNSVDGFYTPVFPEDTVLPSSQKSVFPLSPTISGYWQGPETSLDVTSLPEPSHGLPWIPDPLGERLLRLGPGGDEGKHQLSSG